LDAQERYFWDLTGYLIVRNVLSPEQITAADAALDYCHAEGIVRQAEPDSGAGDSQRLRGSGHRTISSSQTLFTLPHPHCEPFRRMLAHPAIVGRLNVMCGRAFVSTTVRTTSVASRAPLG